MGWQDRTVRLIGEEAVEKLNRARVAVFGVGGVGSFVAEALVRAGSGALRDTMSPTAARFRISTSSTRSPTPRRKARRWR